MCVDAICYFTKCKAKVWHRQMSPKHTIATIITLLRQARDVAPRVDDDNGQQHPDPCPPPSSDIMHMSLLMDSETAESHWSSGSDHLIHEFGSASLVFQANLKRCKLTFWGHLRKPKWARPSVYIAVMWRGSSHVWRGMRKGRAFFTNISGVALRHRAWRVSKAILTLRKVGTDAFSRWNYNRCLMYSLT